MTNFDFLLKKLKILLLLILIILTKLSNYVTIFLNKPSKKQGENFMKKEFKLLKEDRKSDREPFENEP